MYNSYTNVKYNKLTKPRTTSTSPLSTCSWTSVNASKYSVSIKPPDAIVAARLRSDLQKVELFYKTNLTKNDNFLPEIHIYAIQWCEMRRHSPKDWNRGSLRSFPLMQFRARQCRTVWGLIVQKFIDKIINFVCAKKICKTSRLSYHKNLVTINQQL